MRRRLTEGVFHGIALLATLALLAALGLILWTIAAQGARALNWTLITQPPTSGSYTEEGGGGIAHALIGSLYLAGGATLLALLISVPAALYLRVYASSWFAGAVRLLMDVLWGVPSIVFGAFGFTLMLLVGLRASLLAGIITVALFELPIMIRAIDEVMTMAPRELEEAAYSVGATRAETAVRVIMKQALPGIVTGVLLAFGRGIGDAASVMFTAGFTDHIPTGVMDKAATLPLAIFFQLGTPFAHAHERAYGAALLLVILVLMTSVVARVISARLGRYSVQ
ncbi:MAG TPA: phosphate ABC transporter permease PstA [Armatimonadota bacterium]|nr:phosphate ABC transporter permease PstA [Armatimonadota bacterium]HOS43108.1 phosphate ABC transporter permease PstA [Armatimonadota bacterium]